MAIKKLFKSHIPFVQFFFKSGKQAAFVNGEYATDIEVEIEELNAEIAAGHPHLYIDAAKKEIDTTNTDPLAEIKAKAISEFLAKQAEAINAGNDRGETANTGKVEGIVSSTDIAQAAAGNTNAPTATTSLANLKISTTTK